MNPREVRLLALDRAMQLHATDMPKADAKTVMDTAMLLVAWIEDGFDPMGHSSGAIDFRIHPVPEAPRRGRPSRKRVAA